MACVSPLKMYRAAVVNPSGRRSLVFNVRKAEEDAPVIIPCGQCISCRLERSRQWAVRCVHEASLYPHNSFVTLTYNDENLPPGGTLVKRHVQLFLKRLRKFAEPARFRYYYCGEYGDVSNRPHYHLLLFNFRFVDAYRWRKAQGEHYLYRSETLERLWPFGSSEIGTVTFDSAAYVARYVVKKVTGDNAEEHYRGRVPEFGEPSRRPGIGYPWFEKFFKDVYPDDFVVLRGQKMLPPRAYDRWLERLSPDDFSAIKDGREPQSLAEMAKRSAEGTKERLAVKEEVTFARLNNFSKRSV